MDEIANTELRNEMANTNTKLGFLYLEDKVKESKVVITLKTLDKTVNTELRNKAVDTNAKLEFENLLITYQSLLTGHSLFWIVKDSQQTAACHVPSTITP